VSFSYVRRNWLKVLFNAQLRDGGVEFPNNKNYPVKGKSKFYHSTCYEGARGGVVVKALRCYATNRQVAGSIPDVVIGIFPVAL